MARKETQEMEKVTLNLFKGDFAKLRELHPQLGAGKAARVLVRSHIQKVEEEMAQSAAPIPLSPLTKEVLPS